MVEAATDNNTRTVANVRSYFNKHGGNLGTQGSLSFLFDHKSIFKIKPKEGVDHDELELEAIDYGVEEIVPETVTINEDGDEMNVWAIYGPFEEFANIQKFVEEAGLELVSAEFARIPNDLKEVTAEQRASLEKLLEKFEEDEDVQNVYHNMKEEEE